MTFDEVYRRFRGPVWRLARRMTRSEEEALDATQEIFLRIWRGLGGFRHEAKLSTWIFQIAWNYLRWHRRQRRRRPRLLEEAVSEQLQSVVDPSPCQERRAVARDLVARVEGALGELSEEHRLVVWLRDGEGLSYAEIAAVLDVPIGTVRSRLARARRMLRDAVKR